MDPLLTDADQSRFTLKKMDGPVWEMYKQAERSFWTAEEVDLSRDLTQWNDKLTQPERDFIKIVLAFFASSDGIVNENLAIRFYNDVKMPEARAFYALQIFMETVHAEMYSRLISTYVPDVAEQNRMFCAVNEVPAIKLKADWALKWISAEERSFGERLVAFACVEGIFFSSSFAAIFWIKKRGLLPGLTLSNEFISRDEGMHTNFACLLFRELMPTSRPSSAIVKEIIHEAGELEKTFVREALPVALLGMNADLMCQYIEFITDRLATELNTEVIYSTSNPFDFMDSIGNSGKTNFFERRVADYSRPIRKPGDGELDFSVTAVDF